MSEKINTRLHETFSSFESFEDFWRRNIRSDVPPPSGVLLQRFVALYLDAANKDMSATKINTGFIQSPAELNIGEVRVTVEKRFEDGRVYAYQHMLTKCEVQTVADCESYLTHVTRQAYSAIKAKEEVVNASYTG
jgi:hypothetical protein